MLLGDFLVSCFSLASFKGEILFKLRMGSWRVSVWFRQKGKGLHLTLSQVTRESSKVLWVPQESLF